MRTMIVTWVLAAALFLPTGCAVKKSGESFMRENVELGYVRRIAVLPLQNNTAEEYVAERLRNVITTQILAMGLFDVVDNGLVDAAFREEALKKGEPVDLVSVKRLGRRLGVQALLLGSVDLSQENRKGALIYPEMALSLRLLDAKEALVLWQNSDYRNGYSAWGRLFGLGADDFFEVAFSLVRSMLKTVPAGGEELSEAMEAPGEIKELPEAEKAQPAMESNPPAKE